ncbi:hypothetical protein [uncultured Pseudoalteromonas sp.]|uniref:hypothetical protein n=1 Tax=uncultured Pseudoalteromonas sp. TaxID=114053 RepID=UPI00259AADEC|nr:hypothetical protein [uncultured Pseudoalteromonas sp.]
MYLIKRLFAILAIITVLLVALFAWNSFLIWLDSAEPVNPQTSKETRSKVQWLSTKKPLIYTFSNQRTHSLRILSNAVFDQSVTLEQPVNYAIKYTLYNDKKEVILDEIYHHASKLVNNSEEQQIKQIIENKQSLNVASGQSFYLPIAHYPQAKSLALLLIPEEKSIQGVVVRVHAKTPDQNVDPLSSWLKRPLDRRKRATDYLTMGENTLTNTEIANAMAFWWQKIAPQGIPGIDFKSDILYETLPYNVITYDFNQQQYSLAAYYTNESLCASIRLDNSDSLIFTVSNNQALPLLTWYDKLQFEAPKEISFSQTDEVNTYKTPLLNAGLITICSEEELLTQWRTESGTVILTSYAGSYLINPKASVEFDIVPASHLNLELRTLKSSQLDVTLYDKNKKPIERYAVTIKGEASKFDRLIANNTQRQAVGMLTSYYLRTPQQAHSIKVESSDDVYLRVKTRLANFHYQRRTAHQPLTTESTDGFYDIAAWYEQKASNHYDLAQREHFVNIRTFIPPRDIEDTTTYYQSKELFNVLPLSNVALGLSPNRYFEKPEPAQEFNFGIYDNNHYFPSTGENDNRLIFKLNSNSANEVKIADISLSEQMKLIKESNTVYQNWYGHRPWIKQRLYQLDKNKPIKLLYDKKEHPTSIVVKAFRTQSNKPITLNINHSANYKLGLTSEYSIAKQSYQLHSSELLTSFLIHPKKSQLTSYPSVTFKVANDINFLQSVTLTSSETIWLSILEEYPVKDQKVRWWNNEL